ncbi:MAG: T9SS type A sorting domain-containing protein, partial [Bacteroidales bacterium]|nr:T9SS type A sorting domain-containing protein [Bacteroidales bacterium]
FTAPTGDCKNGTYIVTFSAGDECGNIATTTANIVVNDNVAPTLPELPTGGDLGCNPVPPTCVDDLMATDNCAGQIPVVCEAGDIIEDPCGHMTQVFTYTATDDCGNSSSETVTYTWIEDDLQINCPSPVYLDCEDIGETVGDISRVEYEYNNWKAGFTASATCGYTDNMNDFPALTYNNDASISLEFTYMVDGICEHKECTSTFYVPACCETAYGYYDENSICFLEAGLKFNNWGWTTQFTPVDGIGNWTMTLYSGAGAANDVTLCDPTDNPDFKGTAVGTVNVTYANNTVTLTYDLYENYSMSQAQVFIGCEPFPKLKNGKYTNALGSYTYNADVLTMAQDLTVEFTDVTGPFWLITHAVACEIVPEIPKPSTTSEPATKDANLACSSVNSPLTKVTKKTIPVLTKVYPNPFSKSVSFEIEALEDTRVRVDIFNNTGSLIDVIYDENLLKGDVRSVILDGSTFMQGEYIYRVSTNAGFVSGTIVKAR